MEEAQHQNAFYPEDLGGRQTLSMMEIPEGEFMMGSPEGEMDRRDDEGPQHWVKISRFYMSQTPITQTQWRIVAQWPFVNIELQGYPSYFEGEKRPVEEINWFEAVEFCDRLTQHTGRPYRLPTEAEWEYACRAGTTTPFYFGETITTELANYRGTDWEEYNSSGSYGSGPKGTYRGETTPVDQFQVTHPYGLSDMHGNVLEWCQDTWHSHYDGAPVDGSAWVDEEDIDSDKVLRGGYWGQNPGFCRSAYRSWTDPDNRNFDIGFRVVCSLQGLPYSHERSRL